MFLLKISKVQAAPSACRWNGLCPATIAWGDSGEMEKAIAMLDAVKDSIINAYEIKSGLSRSSASCRSRRAISRPRSVMSCSMRV